MAKLTNKSKSSILNQILHRGRRHYKQRTGVLFASFADQYLENVPLIDLDSIEISDLFRLISIHWGKSERKATKKPQIEIFNTTSSKHEFSVARTIIQIVTNDMPFLVDSVSAELNRQNLDVRVVMHPILNICRNKSGKIIKIVKPNAENVDAISESFMQFQLSEQPPSTLSSLKNDIERCVADVSSVSEDKDLMHQKMCLRIKELSLKADAKAKDEQKEVLDFLNFLADKNFMYLGFREYMISGSGRKAKVRLNQKSNLGLLRDSDRTVFEDYKNKNNFPPETAEFLARQDLLIVTKTNNRSSVHRSVHMDAIGVKKLDKEGRVIGLQLFIGLFTASAYSQSPKNIPLLRNKIKDVFSKSQLKLNSHDGKALESIFESYPRDELFQVSEENLLKTVMGILYLQKRPKVAFFVRTDIFKRYVSCLVFLPRELFTTAVRRQCQDIISRAFVGVPAAFFSQLGDSPLARVHLIIKIPSRQIPKIDPRKIEKEIANVARPWEDKVASALAQVHDEATSLKLVERYKSVFSAGYQSSYSIADVILDINEIEKVIKLGGVGLNLYQNSKHANKVRFKIYHKNGGFSLSDVLPVFEHMGFKVINEVGPHPVKLNKLNLDNFIIHDFGLETRNGKNINLKGIRQNFHEAFERIWSGDAESDGFNSLIIAAGLSWREVVILRGYCKYLRQTNFTFSQTYMEQALSNNSRLAHMLVELFLEKFEPKNVNRNANVKRIQKRFFDNLEKVISADEDRILNSFFNLISATLRTNYFQTTNGNCSKNYLSYKLNSKEIEELPLPKPFREIFVYSPRFEGIHLRFGKVARGGLRWSDRPEDFRTEILGLVKAQQVKNAVIVPVGSKGGFVIKRPPTNSSRQEFLNEGIACYQDFIAGLLDLTDNIIGSRIVSPKNVICFDDKDPYLVVAADKGTATFSDIANSVSKLYGHWLGDAFASGGSQGYDHKKMGITARGGWESVKRHFREMGVDTQSEVFKVVGVGDMSGDVFGNGMLLSKKIKLVAAFNHLQIFIDPNPDPKISFSERKRLFRLPQSMWSDYDPKVLSKGGEIFERNSKVVTLSSEIQSLLEIEKKRVTPNELLRYILKINSDLLWFGGIGTYIKSSQETNAEVGDRANDGIRINGNEVRSKVIGEGANLGLTQLGRIEAAKSGVRLYTDAIDNSAGVDSSDHEVNIKILLNGSTSKGQLSYKDRNVLLASMTEEVGTLVLRHNYDQTQAIEIVCSKGGGAIESQMRLMHFLEREYTLNRSIEYLPNDEELNERLLNKNGLYSPEISVLINYAKNWLYEQILISDLPDDQYLYENLIKYFPTPLHVKFKKDIRKHKLNREIISTRLANSIVNRGGDTFVTDFIQKTGRTVNAISRAWFIAQEIFSMPDIWREIEALDNQVRSKIQTEMMKNMHQLLEWATLWFLRNGDVKLNLKLNIDSFHAGILKLSNNLTKVLPHHYISDASKRCDYFQFNGVPSSLANKISHLINLYPSCDIVRLAATRRLDVLYIAKIYYSIGSQFRLGRLRAAADIMEPINHWQSLAISALTEELYSHQLRLTESVIDASATVTDKNNAVAFWLEKNSVRIEPVERLLADLWSGEVNDLSMISVASRQIRSLIESSRN